MKVNRHLYQNVVVCGGEGERERDSNIRGSSEVHRSAVEAHCPACSILPGDETSRLHGKYILNFFYKL